MRPAREALQARTADASAFGSGDTDNILRRLGLLHSQPSLPAAAVGADGSTTPRERLSLDVLPREEIPALLGIDRRWLDRRLPVLALLMGEADLRDLIKRPRARGRETEKRGFVAFIDDGEVQFASGVGVRLHGGETRVYQLLRDFRLHFRDIYGADRFEPRIFPGAAGRLVRQLVIDNNNDGLDARGRRWHFVDPLSYDIARAIGAPAPATLPTVFFLNGRHLGVYILTEYIDLDHIRARYGHDRFVLVRTKRNKRERGSMVKAGDPARYHEFLAWLSDPAPMTWERAAGRVDLENLSHWFLTVLFCATGDIFNGPMLLDETDPSARWFWIPWDLEIGFGQPYFPRQQGWQRDIIRFAFHPRHRRNPRSVLLRRLFDESPDFRTYFADLFSEVMNHRLTPEFLDGRLGHYREIAARAELPDTDFFDEIEEFLGHRKAALRDQLRQHLSTGESYRVEVEAPASAHLVIDGHAKGSRFAGWYFDQQTIEISLDTNDRGARVEWTINNELLPGSHSVLRLEVAGDLSIRVEKATRRG